MFSITLMLKSKSRGSGQEGQELVWTCCASAATTLRWWLLSPSACSSAFCVLSSSSTITFCIPCEPALQCAPVRLREFSSLLGRCSLWRWSGKLEWINVLNVTAQLPFLVAFPFCFIRAISGSAMVCPYMYFVCPLACAYVLPANLTCFICFNFEYDRRDNIANLVTSDGYLVCLFSVKMIHYWKKKLHLLVLKLEMSCVVIG